MSYKIESNHLYDASKINYCSVSVDTKDANTIREYLAACTIDQYNLDNLYSVCSKKVGKDEYRFNAVFREPSNNVSMEDTFRCVSVEGYAACDVIDQLRKTIGENRMKNVSTVNLPKAVSKRSIGQDSMGMAIYRMAQSGYAKVLEVGSLVAMIGFGFEAFMASKGFTTPLSHDLAMEYALKIGGTFLIAILQGAIINRRASEIKATMSQQPEVDWFQHDKASHLSSNYSN